MVIGMYIYPMCIVWYGIYGMVNQAKIPRSTNFVYYTHTDTPEAMAVILDLAPRAGIVVAGMRKEI